MSKRPTAAAPEHKDEQADSIEMSVGRVEALSDGIFAVAMTLLVLNIQVPRVDKDQPASALIDTLLSQWPVYAAYFLSFITLGIAWLSHHQMLRLFRRVDSRLQLLNLLTLAWLTLIPFTTSLLAAYIEQVDKAKVVAVVYEAVWVIASLFFALVWRYAVRHQLLKPAITDADLHDSNVHFTLGMGISVFGLFLAFISPGLSLLCSVLAAFMSIPSARINLRKRSITF